MDIFEKIRNEYDFPYGEAFFLPRGYNNTGSIAKIEDAVNFEDGTMVVLFGTLNSLYLKTLGSSRVMKITGRLFDESNNSIGLEWMSALSKAEYKKEILERNYGSKYVQVSGEISSYISRGKRVVFLKKVEMQLSAYVKITESIQAVKMIPIYKLKKKIKKYEIESFIKNAINEFLQKGTDFPKEVEEKYNLPNIAESLNVIHGYMDVWSNYVPEILAGESPWNKRIQLEMIWFTLKYIKNETEGHVKAPKINIDENIMNDLREKLPFDLTKSQNDALDNIYETLSSGKFERMLLQGDVGSGKTLVSIFATKAMLASEYNQVVVIAPSIVLATQLYEEYEKYLDDANVFLTAGKVGVRIKRKVQKSLDEGKPTVVIGTSIVNNFEYSKLGLLIVDEEQKMGVRAKDALLKNREILPHQMLMSATPIPRSLAQAVFGNAKIVKIESKPEGRIDVKTKVIKNEESLKKMMQFIYSEAKNYNRKTLFVAPSIASGEIASVESIVELCKKNLMDLELGIIHGEMKEENIMKEIQKFKNSEKHVLIATSMVEAGFSVPDMSTVVIVGPDRFGLSQLHQIRGRGGRSAGLHAYCALLPLEFKLSQKAIERLSFFAKEHDGFVLSKKDLDLRGAGELIGMEQSGVSKIDFMEHEEEIEMMRKFL